MSLNNLLTNIREYIREYSYNQKKEDNNDILLQDMYDSWLMNIYQNGRLYINEDPLDTRQLSFRYGLMIWIDTTGLGGHEPHSYLIETSNNYDWIWDKMYWELDGEEIIPKHTVDGSFHSLNFGDLRSHASLTLTVEPYKNEDVLYKGFVSEYINDFEEY